MYQIGDIIAVYGETICGQTLHINHPTLDSNAEQEMVLQVMDGIPEFIVCQIEQVYSLPKGEVAIKVRRLSNQLNEPTRQYVFAKQCRLMQRDGKDVEKKEAVYIYQGYLDNHDGDGNNSIYGRTKYAHSVVSNIKSDAESIHDEYDPSDINVNIFKGFEVTEQFDIS